jgi:hypothetical protein
MKFTRTRLPEFSHDISEGELQVPDFVTVVKVIWYSIRSFFTERPGQIIGATFLLIMAWGTHGRLELLGYIWPDWRGPGIDLGNRPQLIPGVPWDNELISFFAGALLLVGFPILMIKFFFKQPLALYGLGLPPRERWLLAVQTFLFVTVISLPFFWIGAHVGAMRQLYPLYRPFDNTGSFVLYELSYLPFFIAIEFIFRGFLLFGLAGVQDTEITDATGDTGIAGPFTFGRYALLIQMLSYTAWHLGKPALELWGTLVWGLTAGATAYMIRSIWPIALSHWLLNVFIDALIWRSL